MGRDSDGCYMTAGRKRKEGREHWPANLYMNPGGTFWYRCPQSKKTKSLGFDEAKAIEHAVILNGSSVASMPSVLLTEDQIVSKARPFSALAGVYFLISNSKIVYVGQSENVGKRLAEHRWDGVKVFDAFHVVECDRSLLIYLERKYIQQFAPLYNIAAKTDF